MGIYSYILRLHADILTKDYGFLNIFIDLQFLQSVMGLDGKRLEAESNVLLASIENMQYAVTLDVLHMVL
jgi:hypothetical protein